MNISDETSAELAKLANRSMKMQVNVQDGDAMVSVDGSIVYVTPEKWKKIAS